MEKENIYVEKPSIRKLMGYDVVLPDKISLQDDIMIRHLAIEENQGRRLRKRKKISYDVNAMVREERKSTFAAAKEARRQTAFSETRKRRAKRQQQKEEKRKRHKALQWTREKKDNLMADYLLLKELSIKNHGEFKYEEIIAEVYESHGYLSLNKFNRFRKACLDDMKEWIEYYLKDEKNHNNTKGTEEQHMKIKDLYLDLCEKIDTEDIQDDARDMISDNMDKFFGDLGLAEDDEGNYELDMDLLNYSQCKRLIDFLIECIVQYKVGVQVKNYFDYKQSIARLNQTINRIRKSKLN